MSSAAKTLCALLLVVGVRIPSRALAAEDELGPEGRAAVSALADAIQSKNTDGIRDGVRKIRRLEAGAQAIPILIAGLDSKDRKVQREVVESLGRVSPTTAEVISLLFALHVERNEDDDIGGAAWTALIRIGPPAVPLLRNALDQKEARIRRKAAGMLHVMGASYIGVLGKDVAHDLMGALQDQDADVRRGAAYALGRVGPEATEAIPSLIDLLKDKDEQVRTAACDALGRIGPAAKPAIPELRRIARNDPSTDCEAMAAMGRIGPTAVNTLAELLSHKDAHVRRNAARALQRIGPDGKTAVPALIERLVDEESAVRFEATLALFAVAGWMDLCTPVLTNGLKENPEYGIAAIRRWDVYGKRGLSGKTGA